MTNLRMMLFLLPTILLNCSASSKSKADKSPAKAPELKADKSPANYGGVFRMNIIEDFRSLYPLSIVETPGRTIASQIYEGLVKNDPSTLEVYPSLAEKWMVNSTSDEFYFTLRSDVYFHDDACFEGGVGRKLVAGDIKYCLQKLIHESYLNYNSTLLKGIIESDSAFTVINDSLISIHTIKPCTYLTAILAMPCCWIYPKEAFEKYGDDMRVHAVGTGPFYPKSIMEGETTILQRNPKYWRKDNYGGPLPYLDMIQIRFIKDKRSELIAFRNDELDVLDDLSPDGMSITLEGLENGEQTFQLLSSPSLSLTYYGFLCTKAPFNNVKVRQAFNYAIDRNQIVNRVLRGGAVAANNGFVPPGIPGYTNTDVGYGFDVDKARQLLREAGYPNGKGFPEITLYTNSGGGERNVTVAEVVQNMLKENLGINIIVSTLPFVQHLENYETGKSLFWRTGWVADMVDPRVFLELAYGGNVPANESDRATLNPMRFKNKEFDVAFDKATVETNSEVRMKYYKEAETIATKNAFIMPIFFETNTALVHNNVKGYHVNALDMRDLSEVYFGK